MDIKDIQDLEIGKRLVIFERSSLANGLVDVCKPIGSVLVEGYSFQHNCIYGRVLHGRVLGTLMKRVPGWGLVCIRHSDLNGFKVEVK